MAFMEDNQFINLEEYEASRANRVNEYLIRPEEIYMAMFRLDSQDTPAAKIATRVLEVASIAAEGVVEVKFTFLDGGLQGTEYKTARCRNGYLVQFGGGNENGLKIFSADEKGETSPDIEVKQGYFKDYFEDFYNYMRLESKRLEMASL